jgi:Rap1a immunity proteins
MKSIAFALTVSGALLATAASPGQPAMTAGDLGQLCAGTDHVSRNACRIYILGVTQGITLGLSIAEGKSAGGRPCVPAGLSAEALEQTVQKRLVGMSSAAERDRDAAGFIAAVLGSAFPCAKQLSRPDR